MPSGPRKIYFAILISLAIFAFVIALFFFMPKKNQVVPEEQEISEETGQPIPLPPPSFTSEWEKKKEENKFQPYKTEKYSYDVLGENPTIVGQAKVLMPGFSISKIAVSTPATKMQLGGGREVFLLSGCEEHNCGGTAIVIAYDKSEEKTYLLKEENSSGEEYAILGNPDEEIRNLLVDYYYNE